MVIGGSGSGSVWIVTLWSMRVRALASTAVPVTMAMFAAAPLAARQAFVAHLDVDQLVDVIAGDTTSCSLASRMHLAQWPRPSGY
jgi:hypothetical protein